MCINTYSWSRQSHVMAACDLTQLWRRALTSIYNWIRGSYWTWQRPCVGKLHCQQTHQEFQLVKFAEYEVQPRKPPKIRRSVLSTGVTKYPLSVGFWNTAVYRSSAPLWLMEEGLPSFFYLTLLRPMLTKSWTTRQYAMPTQPPVTLRKPPYLLSDKNLARSCPIPSQGPII